MPLHAVGSKQGGAVCVHACCLSGCCPAIEGIPVQCCCVVGGEDSLSVPADVSLLKQQLHDGVVVHHHHEHNYAHLDFEIGTDAPDAIYPQIIQLAEQYSQQH